MALLPPRDTWVEYIIHFSDPGEYAHAIAVAGGNRIIKCPYDAATLFGIPWPLPSGAIEDIPKGISSSSNGFGIPAVPGPGKEINYPSPSGRYMKSDVDRVLVFAQAAAPPWEDVWPRNPDHDTWFTWVGTILKYNNVPEDAVVDETVAGIPRRRWIGGMELTADGEGGSGASQDRLNRVSTRVGDGHGMSIRGNMATNLWNRRVDTLRPSLTTKKSWERFYVRVVTGPQIPCGIWKCNGTPDFTQGAGLKIGVGPSLILYNIEPAGFTAPKGTFALTLNEWYLIDILTYVDTGVDTEASVRVFVNHELALSYVESSGLGINALNFHIDSSLGKWTLDPDAVVEIDLDDWMCADVPMVDGVEVLNSIDWGVGSHVRPVFSQSVVATSWAGGNVGTLNHGISSFNNLSANYTSSTSGATITGLTGATQGEDDGIGFNMGPVSLEVSEASSNSTGTDGRIGYKIAGAAAVTTQVDEGPGIAHNVVGYFPTGLLAPFPLAPLSVVKTKSTNAAADVTTMLQSVVEYIGVWGHEDAPQMVEPYDRTNYLHNCRYLHSPFATLGQPPAGHAFAVGGTYVGNGVYQEITLPAECHFLWIRPTTGAVTGGVIFLASSMAAHFGGRTRTIPNIRVFSTPLGEFKFSVDGTSLACNQNAITYQYIAFCDPGMRFNLCGSYSIYNNGIERSVELVDPTFVPAAVFIQFDDYQVTSNAIGLAYKGPGYVGPTGNFIDGTAIPDFGSFGPGYINTQPGIQYQGTQVNYSLWRTADNCDALMSQACSYVGDGTGNRNIPVTPFSGRYPLFAFIQPHDGEAYFRDPSHTGSSSCTVNSLVASSGAIIGGGIDFLTVGSILNSLGIIYDVFVIPGAANSWRNGTFYAGICSLGPQFLPPPEPPLPGINILAEGGLMFNGTTSQLLMKDISGIYTLIPDKRNDTYIDRQPAQTEIQVRIPEPNFKTGFIGG